LGIIKKQTFVSSIYLYAGIVIGFVVTGILAPNFLTEGQIGTLNLLASYSGIFASIGVLGFNAATVRFFPYFRDKNNGHHGFLFLSLLVGTMGFLIFLSIYYPIKPWVFERNELKSPLFAQFFYLIVPLTFFQIYFTLMDVYNNMLYKSTVGILMRELVQRLIMLLGLLFFIFTLIDFSQYTLIYVAAICLPTVFLGLYLIANNSFNIRFNPAKLKKTILRGMLGMSVFGLLNNLSNMAFIRIDAIMVNYFINEQATGIYVTTFYFGALVQMPARALNRIAPVMIAEAFKKNDYMLISDIYKKSCINLYLIGLLIFLGLGINLDNIFRIIPQNFEAGRNVIVIIALVNLLKMVSGLSQSIIAFSKHYRYNTLFQVILLVAIIVFNLILIPALGLDGAALASLLAVLIWNLAKFVFVYKKFGFQPYNFKFLAAGGITLLLYFLITLLPMMSHFIVDILIRSTLAVVVFVPLMYLIKFSEDLNNSLDDLFKILKKL